MDHIPDDRPRSTAPVPRINLKALRKIRKEVRVHEGGHHHYKKAGGQCMITSEEICVKFGWPEFSGHYRLKDGRIAEHALVTTKTQHRANHEEQTVRGV